MKIEAKLPDVKFDEADAAAAAVLRKRVLARAETVRHMAPQLKQRAVAVAGVEDAKVLEAVREACAKVPEGKDWREARKEVAAAIGDDTATRRRAETVLRANCETARAQARWRDIQKTKAALPYLMYQTMQDEGVRPSHKALDGKVLPVDDEFWKTHYPPWDWGCRCTVVQIDAEQARELEEAGVAKMASEEFKEDFRARYGNEKHSWSFNPDGDADWTDEKAMGISEDERKNMHDVLSGKAHMVVNERGERENAWEYLWRTGPQKRDEARLRALDRTVEHVIVRDAETGTLLEEASGTADEVETKTDWYDETRDGHVRTTHIHQFEVEPLPSPQDLVMALSPRSERETVVSRRLKASLNPRPEERGEKAREEWKKILDAFAEDLRTGKMTRRQWREWLEDHGHVFGFERTVPAK
jgi:SPP1 gp7 family putative phage head morphogenesis protein